MDADYYFLNRLPCTDVNTCFLRKVSVLLNNPLQYNVSNLDVLTSVVILKRR